MKEYIVSYVWNGKPKQVKVRAMSDSHARMICRAHKIPYPTIQEQGLLKL